MGQFENVQFENNVSESATICHSRFATAPKCPNHNSQGRSHSPSSKNNPKNLSTQKYMVVTKLTGLLCRVLRFMVWGFVVFDFRKCQGFAFNCGMSLKLGGNDIRYYIMVCMQLIRYSFCMIMFRERVFKSLVLPGS